MKIREIKNEKLMVYTVTFTPNWLEKLFGVKEKTEEFLQTWSTFSFGGGAVYRRKDGSELGCNSWIGEELDKFRRKW